MPCKITVALFVIIVLTVSSLFADVVYLKDGSIVKGKITEQSEETVKITTFDGSIFVYKQAEIKRITYGKAKSPKSGAVAIVLSLLFPGIGDFYVGNNGMGALWLATGAAGAGLMFYGMSQKDEFNWDTWKVEKKGETEAGIGALIYLGSTVASCITAYKGTKNYGQASLFEVRREKYTIKILPQAQQFKRQALLTFAY